MNLFSRTIERTLGLTLLLILSACAAFGQQAAGTLRGQIKDEFGGAIIGATVTVTNQGGAEKTATTNDEGVYTVGGLSPGRYTVRAQSTGFAVYENAEVDVAAGSRETLDIRLTVTIEEQNVTVAAETPLSIEPENNSDAVVLRGSDLDALPDDPDDLAAALQALAGPSAGPNGAEIFIDGFSGGRLPPKESIREIRLNQNPFTAENDRPGGGRIEILTKPGTEKFGGQVFFNFMDESLNSRNPFANARAPFQLRQYGGNLSGPLSAKRASFFFDFERRETDDNDIVNATILDPNFNIVPFNASVLTPQRRTTFSPRIDFQLNSRHTLVARYTYSKAESINQGVGGFSLPTRGFNQSNTQHTFQLTETAVLSEGVINETRFQYVRQRNEQDGDNSQPTINVLEAFTGGGSQIGQSFTNEDRFELQNNTSWTWGNHSLKAGGRLRHVRITDISPQNFGGTFTFAGGFAPQLDAGNQIIFDGDGQPVFIPITSIERYQRTLLLQQAGLSPEEIQARGGGATQFSIAGGNEEALVSQWDFGGFIQDDWRMRPNFTLSMGLRYETQSNIDSNFNFAPRLAFAWSPGAGNGKTPKTVVRGGFGIYYERFSESFSLQANRFNGINQQQFTIADPLFFPDVPSIETLEGSALPQTIRQIAPDLQAPRTIMGGLQVERQLPYNMTLFVRAYTFRTRNALRARNINAPLPGTFDPSVPGSNGVRPLGSEGDIFQYESSGRIDQNQLTVGLNSRFNRSFSIFANYTLTSAKSDTDGANTFPANSYDLSGEYGRSAQDVRHRFTFGGSIRLPWWQVNLSPFIIASSGRPFNITTGRDTNGDNLFTERPAFATDLTRPSVVLTRFGAFDTDPLPGQQIIPRNYGEGPGFFAVNLRISKTFSLGGPETTADAAGQSSPTGGRAGRGGSGFPGGGRGGRGGRGGGGGGGSSERGRYNLTFSINFQNLFNRTNASLPVGNLSSPLFGESLSTAGGFGFGGGGGNPASGNRRVQAQIRFSF
ncbi:MAG: carboxypeptidase regulatory-like domain-containing protein [Pyrinomonadaceae bacterium]